MRCLLCTLVGEQALDKHHGRRVALQCAVGWWPGQACWVGPPGGGRAQAPRGPESAAPQVRRHRSIHEVDISNLEAALRAEEPGGQAYETPREEIARLRKMELEPQHYDVDINKEVTGVQQGQRRGRGPPKGVQAVTSFLHSSPPRTKSSSLSGTLTWSPTCH